MDLKFYQSPDSGEIDLRIEQSILAASLFDANNYTENFLDGGEEDL